MLPTNHRAVKGRPESNRACAYPLGGCRCLYSLTFLERLSEKSRRRSQRSLTGRQGGVFGPFRAPYSGQILAWTVARTLLGQSQKKRSRKLGFRYCPILGNSNGRKKSRG
jgi:hypothetical protein